MPKLYLTALLLLLTSLAQGADNSRIEVLVSEIFPNTDPQFNNILRTNISRVFIKAKDTRDGKTKTFKMPKASQYKFLKAIDEGYRIAGHLEVFSDPETESARLILLDFKKSITTVPKKA